VSPPLLPGGQILSCLLSPVLDCPGRFGESCPSRSAEGISVDNMPEENEIRYLQTPLYLTLLRLHQARGDYDITLALSEWLLQMLDETKPTRWVIEILGTSGACIPGEERLSPGLSGVKKGALALQPDGYVRIFLDEGEPMAKLLYQARSHQVETGYAAELYLPWVMLTVARCLPLSC